MKRQQFLSKFLAITLVATIIFSVFTVSVSAVTNDENASAQNASIQNNLSVQGTSSVGAMLANEIEDKNEETEENNGCNVFSVAVSGNNAVISFETIVDATLLVAIYNENCDTLIATGTTEVKKGETERNVTLDTENMPQYFYVKGYLIDTVTNKPLCTAYSSPMYTKEMQEFLAKTTDDFDENKVLNFDNEDDNNFAVYNGDVKLVDDSGDKNKVTKSDDTTKTYVIENIDESISSLNEGDIFSYNYSDGDALVVKIANITIDGTTATITGADTELDEVFDYVKIDSTAKKSDFTYDDSNLSDELKVEEASSRSRTSRAVDMEASAAFSTGFAINYSPNDTISVTGSLSFGLSVSAKVYVSLSYQYLELISKQSLGVEISVSATMFSHDFSLGEYGVFPVPGLYISIEPAVSFEGEIEVSFGASVETQFGFSVSSSEGYKDLSKAAEIKTELKVKGKLFIGLKVTGKVKLLGAVAEGGISGKIGPEISAEFAETGNNEDYKHDCGTCLKGEINYIKGISVYAKFFNSDKLKFEWSASKSYKGGDFYYSFDYNQFGFTTCPHITYKVTVAVRDKGKKPVSGATVNGTETTDSNGIAILYLPNGNHSITASYSGQAESTVLTVNNAATSAELVFGGSQGNTDYDFTPTGEIAPIAAGSNHSAAVTKDGDLYMWGSNGGGRLGNGNRTNSYTPVKIMKNVAAVSLGDEHSAAVTKDGSLYMWGANYCGQLGNGSTTDSYTPIKIMKNVATVSLGGIHSAAVTKDGSLYMWGYNNYGQLGNGTTNNLTRPQRIAVNVQSVELGNYHTTAVSKDGGLYTWGYNKYGELGNGTTNNSYTPVKIMSDVVSSAGGSHHTIALKKNGTVYTWGDNEYGELGNGNKSNQTSPVAIQIYDRTNVLRAKQALEPVGASSSKHTAKFAGYTPNGIYNFYSLKNKNVDKLLTDDNVLYVDQVRADANGNISVTYTPKADCDTPYEFVASITQINLSNAEVTAENLTYNGKTQAVKPVVKVNDYTLYEGIDYTLTGAYEAKNAGEYTYTIVGKGDFVGYTTKTFTINTVDVNDCKVSGINSVPYSGKEIKPDVAVTMDGYTLAKDVDYTVEYQNNLNVGIGIVVIKGIGNFTGRNICWFDITRCDISTIPKIVVKNCEYSGKAVVPEMILENNGIALVKDKDYTVTFKNNTSVGTATAIISGIGNYSGTVEKAFTIGNTMVGDVDMNGKVDVNDVTLIMKYNVDLINLSSEQAELADVNNDGYVDVLDVTLLQQYIAGYVTELGALSLR